MATYSTYEAKARFSEVMRMVREGKSVTVTYHGRPVAEIRPIDDDGSPLERRILELEREGVITSAENSAAPLAPLLHRPGALQRFLADRNG